MDDKEQEAREMLNLLYDKIDEGGLNEWQQAMFDVLSWLIEDTDRPELD